MAEYCNSVDDVIAGGYCSGCGVCSYYGNLETGLDENGCYQARRLGHSGERENVICPFSSPVLKTGTAEKVFCSEASESINYEEHIGYFRDLYIGHVKQTPDFRQNGSSGGMTTWIQTKLLEEGYVDAVIHVKENNDNEKILFSYSISETVDEIKKASKTKYYPITLSGVIKELKQSPAKRYAVVGLPCFIRGLRLLAEQETLIKNAIVYYIGLVCGHLKSSFFTDALSWELGIDPQDLAYMDYRDKSGTSDASRYNVKASEFSGQGKAGREIRKNISQIYCYNWGFGFFKYKACDYCDDVLNETADITLGDAWLPDYTQDPDGNNIIIIRNPVISELFTKYADELSLDKVSEETIVQSQSSGFRHRHNGLAYRLYLAEEKGLKVPRTEISPAIPESPTRQEIYKYRILLRDVSFDALKEAKEHNDYRYFKKRTKPLIKEYNLLYRGTFWTRVKRKLRKIFKGSE